MGVGVGVGRRLKLIEMHHPRDGCILRSLQLLMFSPCFLSSCLSYQVTYHSGVNSSIEVSCSL